MPKPAKVATAFVAAATPTDKRFIDLVGQVFTRLTVVSYAGNYEFNCLCACGSKVVIRSGHLRNGNTKSCGCLHKEWMLENNTVHGAAPRSGATPEYKAFHQAKDRCTNTEFHAYNAYGGRGIEFRFDTYDQFIADVGPRPGKGFTLDRIDVNGHYEAGNLRWVTMHEQNRNRSDHRYITIGDVTKCVADWADEYGVSPALVHDRHKRGWCSPCALTLPKRPGQRSCRHVTT